MLIFFSLSSKSSTLGEEAAMPYMHEVGLLQCLQRESVTAISGCIMAYWGLSSPAYFKSLPMQPLNQDQKCGSHKVCKAMTTFQVHCSEIKRAKKTTKKCNGREGTSGDVCNCMNRKAVCVRVLQDCIDTPLTLWAQSVVLVIFTSSLYGRANYSSNNYNHLLLVWNDPLLITKCGKEKKKKFCKN